MNNQSGCVTACRRPHKQCLWKTRGARACTAGVSNNTVHMTGDMMVHFLPSDEIITPRVSAWFGLLGITFSDQKPWCDWGSNLQSNYRLSLVSPPLCRQGGGKNWIWNETEGKWMTYILMHLSACGGHKVNADHQLSEEFRVWGVLASCRHYHWAFPWLSWH